MSCVRFALSPVNAPSAGHTVSAEELESHLNTVLRTTPHNLLLFLQDKVCTIFITQHANRLICAAPLFLLHIITVLSLPQYCMTIGIEPQGGSNIYTVYIYIYIYIYILYIYKIQFRERFCIHIINVSVYRLLKKISN